MRNIHAFLLNSFADKKPMALTTILRTQGSTPQVTGASGVFSNDGLLTGTLGGGVLEAEIGAQAIEALRYSVPRLVEFSLTAGIDSKKGAVCGGEVLALIEPKPEKHKDTFTDILNSLNYRRSGVLATFLSRNEADELDVIRYWIDSEDQFSPEFGEQLLLFKEDIQGSPLKDKPLLLGPRRVMDPAGHMEFYLFLEPVFPKPRLVILGAGHIGRALSKLGGNLDFEVTVIDDRLEFANQDNLPEADVIITERAGTALKNYTITPDTYIVIVTPGHQQDAEALREIVGSKAAYIGMIGSQRKVALMKKQFMEQGWATEDQWGRVHTPIGLDIHSETVEEIAVSIAAQLVQVKNQPKQSQ
jgi:xanthine dehydrogenase accessory factor